MPHSRFDIERLRAGHVDAKPQDRDFSQGWMEEWEFHEAVECDTCERVLVGSGHVECDHEGTHYYGHEANELLAEGPMMNYIYPCRVDDPHEAAAKLDGLPLCIVQDQDDDETYLALTGGGEDLSWEIAEAYMRLDFLPPLHFVRDLPRVSGRENYASTAPVLRAALRSCTWETDRIKMAIDRIETVANDYGVELS